MRTSPAGCGRRAPLPLGPLSRHPGWRQTAPFCPSKGQQALGQGVLEAGASSMERGPGTCVGTWDVERRGRGSGARSLHEAAQPPAPRSRVRGFGLLLRRSTSPSYGADPSAQPPVWLCRHGPAGPLGEARRPPSASSSREPAPRGRLGCGRGRRAGRGSGGAPSKGVGRQKRTQWVGFLWGGAQRGRGLGCSMDAP